MSGTEALGGEDAVFRALADPTRRQLLDALYAEDGQTLGALCAVTPEMTRFGVMKHLRVLAEAELVVALKAGRERRHFLNPVPIVRVAHRWVSRYASPFADGLLDLDARARALAARSERSDPPVPSSRRTPMSQQVEHVHQIHVAARPDQVWAALTESEWTRQYFFGTSFTGPLRAGDPYATVLPDGGPAVDGVVEVLDPPAPGRPGRLVQTWHIRYDPELEQEPAGQVEWTLTELAPGLTRVRLVHRGLDAAPLTAEHVRDGWVWVLDNLKTLLETGRPLPTPVG